AGRVGGGTAVPHCGVGDEVLSGQGPVASAVMQLKGAGAALMVNVTGVPLGAFAGPVPSSPFTCAVNVWVWPTQFTPFGVIEMLASTPRRGSHGPAEGS